MWVAEPAQARHGRFIRMSTNDYFGVYHKMQTLRDGREWIPPTKKPIFPGQPPETPITVCQALLHKSQTDDTDAKTALYVAGRMVTSMPWEFLGANAHVDVVETLWARLKYTPGGLQTWMFAASSGTFFP